MKKRWLIILGIFLLFSVLYAPVSARGLGGENADVTLTLTGRVVNTQGLGVEEGEVRVFMGGEQRTLLVAGEEAEVAHTHSDGSFVVDLTLPKEVLETKNIAVEITHSSFRTTREGFSKQEVACANNHCYVSIPEVVLPRVFNPAFFIATGIFLVVFGFISFNIVHETIAALLGTASMLGVTYLLGHANLDFWIIDFHRAITFIDFDVIFLLMTMMIFMAIMSQTGIFQWMSYRTFKTAKGNAFLVTTILVIITGVFSAVLNDTTVMLLMTPISIQIALAMNIHPAAIVIPEVLASNIGGAASLIGTPPNTIIGSYVGLTFNQFLNNMLPVSLIGMVLLIFMTRWLYKDEFNQEGNEPSEALVEQLERGSQITDKNLLIKSLIVFAGTLIMFFTADTFNMPPAAVAIIGSSALLLWVRPNISEMLREVDWTTLVFFMALFMMVGGIQEVGLIQIIAESVKNLAGDSLVLATLLMIWVSAIASAVVANIPFTAAMVPVAVYLTQTIPGAENNVLYWALAVGAGLGGNATYIGSAPNVVAAGIMDRAGFRLKFQDFSRIGVPITFVTIFVPMFWILLRYFWLNF